ncbi:unnamed protein product [Nesidiocoris tenuis]|uniref:Uncharacterized protein n=1 Tax=Nesidiocoris tenuis TaxID=355587 RepID=A0A6H5GED0_9HEMI|nr:unnamed protein product [Nesidiocoris tenuis]
MSAIRSYFPALQERLANSGQGFDTGCLTNDDLAEVVTHVGEGATPLSERQNRPPGIADNRDISAKNTRVGRYEMVRNQNWEKQCHMNRRTILNQLVSLPCKPEEDYTLIERGVWFLDDPDPDRLTSESTGGSISQYSILNQRCFIISTFLRFSAHELELRHEDSNDFLIATQKRERRPPQQHKSKVVPDSGMRLFCNRPRARPPGLLMLMKWARRSRLGKPRPAVFVRERLQRMATDNVITVLERMGSSYITIEFVKNELLHAEIKLRQLHPQGESSKIVHFIRNS